MSSGYREVGRLDAVDGSAICVGTNDGRLLLGLATPGRQMAVIDLSPEARDELRELLDRAAMPGQPGHAAIAHVVTDPDAHRRHGCPACRADT